MARRGGGNDRVKMVNVDWQSGGNGMCKGQLTWQGADMGKQRLDKK